MEQEFQLSIPHDLRGLAVATHLSGLAGYVVPFGGVIVPIIIWVVKKDTPIIAGIARQAIFLNVAVFLAAAPLVLMAITVILLPVAGIIAIALFLAALALPIVGAIKAWQGEYFRYPVIGSSPN